MCLRHLTHLRIAGIRVGLDLLECLPGLEELILDIAHYTQSAKFGYTNEDVREVVKRLAGRSSDGVMPLRKFTMSVTELGFETLGVIAQSFPKLEKLDLIGGGRDDYLPLTSVYPTDITNNVVSLIQSTLLDYEPLLNSAPAIQYELRQITRRLPHLHSLALPFFLSEALPVGWLEYKTGTTFYLGRTTPLTDPIPVQVSFPSMRDACSILADSDSISPTSSALSKLTFVEFCVPAACYRPEVATLGPFGLKIIGYRWEFSELSESWRWAPVLNSRPGSEIDELPRDGSSPPLSP